MERRIRRITAALTASAAAAIAIGAAAGAQSRAAATNGVTLDDGVTLRIARRAATG